jgi:hypothetical protein
MIHRHILRFLYAVLFVLPLSFLSCQKELTGDFLPPDPVMPPDLTTTVVVAQVSGFVTDANNAAVVGASVSSGGQTVVTNKYGYFEFNNISVVKNAAVVSVRKSGYFPGIKTFVAKAGKGAFFRIKLIPKTNAGSFSAGTGASITLPGGLNIAFPPNSIVVEGSNSPYSGTVNVAAAWINPVASDLYGIMPGDLRGLDTSGMLRTLQTYGMAAVELRGASGELLQMAENNPATLTIPIPATLQGNAPASIPLWYFDEAKGLWKEEGKALKNGTNYVGDVKHFSFWNCDVPSNFVQFECRVTDAGGRAIQNALVKIFEVNNPWNARFGFTDSSGYVGGAVPANSELSLEVYSDPACINYAVTRRFTTTTTDISLGDIVVPITYAASISGTVLNCSGTAVTNGYVIMQVGNLSYHRPLNNLGEFRFIVSLCDVSVPVTLVAEDQAAMQQSNSFPFTVTTGNNDVGVLTACGISSAQFINFDLGGTAYSFTAPADSIVQAFRIPTNMDNIGCYGLRIASGTQDFVSLSFSSTGVAAGSTQSLTGFTYYGGTFSDSLRIVTPISVNVTEYGILGQFIAGNFTGTLYGPAPASTPYPVNCTFRFRRSY